MKKTIKLSSVIAASLVTVSLLTGCGGGSSSAAATAAAPGTAAYVSENTELKGNFTENVTLEASKTYKINGEVNFENNTTLTIPAGTKLYGLTGSSYLAINKGAKIDAQGTATNPIIFTSAQDIAGTNGNDTVQGQWGGLVLIGDAPIVGGTKTYEAGTQVGGGSNPADNSGILNYVMIKNSGFAVEVDKELNGLSLLAVGSGTTIENIAVLSSSDDAIEAWGGTVNLTNVYAFDAGDDSLDTDLGYTGTITNAVVKQKNVDKTNYDSSGIETGNDHDTYTSEVNASTIATQATRATYKDITIEAVGGAIYLKNDAGGIFDNVLVTTKASTVADQNDTAGQAMVTHRTTDTVDDLNGTPTGVEILSGGLALVNDVNSSAIYATRTAKDENNGGNTSDVNQTKDYWEGATGHENITIGVPGAVTGADQSKFDWVLNQINNKETVVLSGDINADMTLDKTKLYAINGEVNVLNGTTLTIPAGTTLYGVSGNSYLCINRGAQIQAAGTQAEPIVFTSAADIAGTNGDATVQGQWGGLTIVGDAPIIGGTKTYEAGTQVGGGTNAADNSGTLQYVVIKNSGYEVEVDKELNGLSLLAVGSGTTIENVAVLSGSDDAIELWGGTVNLTGVYAFDAGDDSLDTDLGYTGTIKDAYVVQKNVDKTNYDSSGIETGNDHDTYTSEVNASTIATQATRATYKNVTVEAVGGAIYLKNDAGGIFDNVLVTTKPSAVTGQADTAGQAMVTHRTTDTVDDLNGTPTGVEILSGGLALVNEVNATAIYATRTAKDENHGGNTSDVNQTKDYWEGATGHENITTGVPGTVTGATIADIWKGKAGSNDQ